MIRAVLQRLGQVSQSGPDKDITNLVRREFGLRARARHRSAYDEACTHSSMLDGDRTGLKSNERLEFLGDVVLDMTMAHYLYRNFPEAQEGELTKRKSRIVNRKNLNLLGKKMGLHHLIKAKMRREDIHDTMVGNALEALIGAVYLDHGFDKTRNALLAMLKRHGLEDQVNETRDFKSKLHHWASKRKKKLTFEVIRDDSNGGEERYEIAAKVNGEMLGIGMGRSKKLAEQEAARRAGKKVFDRRQGTSKRAEAHSEEQPKPKPQRRRRRRKPAPKD